MYKILTDEQISQLLHQARYYGRKGDEAKWTALMTVLANYGPRISEALALQKSDIDFSQQTITFITLKRWMKLPDGHRVRKHVTRTLPLWPAVAEVLQKYLATTNGDPRIFPMPKTGRFIVWRAMQIMLERARIPRTKLHTLRHYCVSRLAETDLIMARDVAGHSNISVTNTYAHVRRMREKMMAVGAIT